MEKRLLVGCQLLTMQTMLVFLLSVFYSLQAPDDDDSCQRFTTEAACLQRKSFLDQNAPYCYWNDASSTACSYRQVWYGTEWYGKVAQR